MQKEQTHLNEITLIGRTARTNNMSEMNPETGKIAKLAGSYWMEQTATQFSHRTNPGVTYCAYTDFESDENGDYTYFIGEAVSSFDDQDLEQFSTLTIPASNYQKFTTEPGPIPSIIINAWHSIWNMTEKDFEGKRTYVADFEIYDHRASDLSNAVVDIFIGIKT